MPIQEAVKQEVPVLFFPPYATEENFRGCEAMIAHTSDQIDYLQAQGWKSCESILAPVREREALALQQEEENRKAQEREERRTAKARADEAARQKAEAARKAAEATKLEKFEAEDHRLIQSAREKTHPLEARRYNITLTYPAISGQITAAATASEKFELIQKLQALESEVETIGGLIGIINADLERDRAEALRAWRESEEKFNA